MNPLKRKFYFWKENVELLSITSVIKSQQFISIFFTLCTLYPRAFSSGVTSKNFHIVSTSQMYIIVQSYIRIRIYSNSFFTSTQFQGNQTKWVRDTITLVTSVTFEEIPVKTLRFQFPEAAQFLKCLFKW